MEFSKLPSKQHALIEYLYNHSDQNSNIELARQFHTIVLKAQFYDVSIDD